ncbi:MAG: peptide-methionine (R)-S-oxide reductase MsrB [Planctomycetota bacterium]
MNLQFGARVFTIAMICGGLCWAAAPDDPREIPQPSTTSTDKTTQIVEPEFDAKKKAASLKKLTRLQFKVTQNADTEQAFRNKYWNNKKDGIYRCVVCGLSLFSSETKFKSGTGWPSFYAPIQKDHVELDIDYDLGYPRKEVHCKRCKAHLGHVFSDGPKETTGLRYCMNSASMNFIDEKDVKREPVDEKDTPQVTTETEK